jgi:glycosyltransferase involved in cell wall biosynthesis
MTRLALFLPDLDGGGSQRTLVNLTRNLRAAGRDATLLAPPTDGPALRWLDDPDAFRSLGAARLRSALQPLRRALLDGRYDALLSSGSDANLIAALAVAALPAAARPALLLRETNSLAARRSVSALQRLCLRLVYPRAQAMIALSRGVGEELLRDYGVARPRLHVIGNPVEVDALAAEAAEASQRPPPWAAFWPTPAPTIAAVGRLHRQKGFDRLVRALSVMRRRDVRLIILGEGPERPSLERDVAALGLGDRVRLVGFQPTPAAWLAHVDLFVLPSRWEGFGHVLVEAMACGPPAVALDCPFGPADILTDPDSGDLLTVDPNNDQAVVDRLADALDRLLDDPARRARMSAGGRRRAQAFSADAVSRAYWEVVEAALRR